MPHTESWEEEFDIVLNSWVRSGMKNTDPVKQAVRNLRTQEREKIVEGWKESNATAYCKGYARGLKEERENLIKIAEGNKKSVKDLFPDAKIEVPDETLAQQVIAKNSYNQALTEIIAEVRKNK